MILIGMFEILHIDTVHGNLQHYSSQITLFFHIGRIEGEVERKKGCGGGEGGGRRKDKEKGDNYDNHVCGKKGRKWEVFCFK